MHSDRGSQFRSTPLVRTLKGHGLTGSMGRVGACDDNAAMEPFFSLVQNNVLDRQRWTLRQELRLAIVTWIEKTHHHRRRQLSLGRLTPPIEFETIETGHQAQRLSTPRVNETWGQSQTPGGLHAGLPCREDVAW